MMAKKKGNHDEDFDKPTLTTVVLARDEYQAEQYRELLADHDIPAEIGDETAKRRGVPVLVTVDMSDDAADIIADFEESEALEAEDVDEDDDLSDDEEEEEEDEEDEDEEDEEEESEI